MLVRVMEFIFKIRNFIVPQYNIRFFIITIIIYIVQLILSTCLYIHLQFLMGSTNVVPVRLRSSLSAFQNRTPFW